MTNENKELLVTCAGFLTIWKWNLRRIMTFMCRPASVDIWYTLNFLLKKKNASQKKFDVNTRVPRHARWDFWAVLDDSLFLYLELDINIWKIEETTKHCEELGDLLLLLLLFIYWRFMGSCATLRWFYSRIWLFPVLTVSYLQ